VPSLYGGNRIAADGGIDGCVEAPADTPVEGFMPGRGTGFQAKADDMPTSENRGNTLQVGDGGMVR
jgi:hypothetical protein